MPIIRSLKGRPRPLAETMHVARCPITGEPAKRLIQWLDRRLLADLWRVAFRIDVSQALSDTPRFGLWESETGLAFFDPMIAGDADFYRKLYGRLRVHDRLAAPKGARSEFAMAAAEIPEGASVLDVGCGDGGFGRLLRAARYTGFDLYFGGKVPGVLAQSVEDHAATHRGEYDVVCSFHVIEHTADPLAFARALAAALRPGGIFFLAVPCWPSPMVSIPNFAVNAPPHHLSWWNEAALRALCARADLRLRRVLPAPVSGIGRNIYWMGRAAPKFRSGIYFRPDLRWHLGLVWAYLAGSLANALLDPPQDAAVSDILMIAEKP